MKKNKKIQLKTKHLCISPKTLEELKLALEKETDPEMQKAYGDMIRGVEEQPEDWLWYTDWTITLKGTETLVGSIGFKGSANESGEVEVGYGIEEEHRRKGYGLEAVNAMMEWAFQNEKVYYIMAETLADNTASQGLLEKAGFTLTGTIGEEGPRFEKEKPQTSFTSLFLSIGMCLGMSVGLTVFDNVATGMCLGMLFGVAVGSAIDQNDKKHREEIRKKREQET